jgi:cytochrome P450
MELLRFSTRIPSRWRDCGQTRRSSGPAVEELLRYAGPPEAATERYAREDVTIEGVTIPRGGLVFAALASANRDERQFPNPDVLDLAREPNRHLAFGLGVHYCLVDRHSGNDG